LETETNTKVVMQKNDFDDEDQDNIFGNEEKI